MLAASMVLAFIPMMSRADNTATESVLDFDIVISDSAPEATGVLYEASWETGEGMEDDEQVNLQFPQEFFDNDGLLEGVTEESDNLTGCSVHNNEAIRCNAQSGGINADEELSVDFEVTNPAKQDDTGTADTYMITLTTSDDTEEHTAQIAIIDPVVVTANIDATLNFEVRGVEEGAMDLHDDTEAEVNVTSEPDLINFGTIEPDNLYTAAQELRVKTNATEGYTVTVFQDGDLTSAAGDVISPFSNNEVVDPTDNPPAWEGPDENLDDPTSWGHFGYTTQDYGVVGDSCETVDLETGENGGGDFSASTATWAGFDGDGERQVMCHTGPVPDPDGDNEVTNVNQTFVGYRVEISQLQPAGFYNNTLTYVATPTF